MLDVQQTKETTENFVLVVYSHVEIKEKKKRWGHEGRYKVCSNKYNFMFCSPKDLSLEHLKKGIFSYEGTTLIGVVEDVDIANYTTVDALVRQVEKREIKEGELMTRLAELKKVA